MTAEAVRHLLGAVLLLSGATLTLLAAVGLLRLPDVLARLQAATKPQVLGLLLIITGVALVIGDPGQSLALVLVGLFQLATAPVLAQLVGRAAYRSGAVPRRTLLIDELATSTGTTTSSDRKQRDEHDESG